MGNERFFGYLTLSEKSADEVCKILLEEGIFQCEDSKNDFEFPGEVEADEIFDVLPVKKGNRKDLASPYYGEILEACNEVQLPRPTSRVLLESTCLPDLLYQRESIVIGALQKTEPFAVYNLYKGQFEPELLQRIIHYGAISE
jgi:hypothetical protein